jgi:hypothetical protein
MSWYYRLLFDGISAAAHVDVPTLLVHSDDSVFPDYARAVHDRLRGQKKLSYGRTAIRQTSTTSRHRLGLPLTRLTRSSRSVIRAPDRRSEASAALTEWRERWSPLRVLSFCERERSQSLRRRLRRDSEPAGIEDAHPAPLALNDVLLLHLPKQFVNSLAAEREHHPETLLRDAHAPWPLGPPLAIAFEQVD